MLTKQEEKELINKVEAYAKAEISLRIMDRTGTIVEKVSATMAASHAYEELINHIHKIGTAQ